MRIFPSEWQHQHAIQLTWPHPDTDWGSDSLLYHDVTECYIAIAREISSRENLIIVAQNPEEVISLLEEHLPMESMVRISLLECDTDDTWARDHGFLTVEEDGRRVYLDYRFNGWGGKFPAENDNAISHHLYDADLLPEGRYEPHLDFELEGGSIESDGEGTILTTAQCNLNPNRRAHIQGDIEAYVEDELRRSLGAKRVLWLHHGALEHDDTDSHIDTLARLCPNSTIVYGEGDADMLAELRTFRTPEGNPYRLVAVPPYYANFLIMNDAVLVPFYDSKEQNQRAKEALESVFADREVIGIDCRVLLRQNGSLHCCTMQYPLI